MIKDFIHLEKSLKGIEPLSITVAAAEDPSIAELIKHAKKRKLIRKVYLTGNPDLIVPMMKDFGMRAGFYEMIGTYSEEESASAAVRTVKNGLSDILIKGKLNSVHYLKAILDKEKGITSSPVLSNLTMLRMPSYHKFLSVTDNAIIPLPTVEEKLYIVLNTLPLMRALGIGTPKVAALSALEHVSKNIPSTVEAEQVQKLSRDGKSGPFIIEGPLSYDVAINRKSAEKKDFGRSYVVGDPDILLMPNIESANILVKSFKFHADAQSGGLVMGASVPVVLNSRSDDYDRRYNSLIMAAAVAQSKNLK